MKFYELSNFLLDEGYLKLTPEANDFIGKVFIPKLKETTINYQNVLVFDVLKAAKTGNYSQASVSELGQHLSYEFTYRMDFRSSEGRNKPLVVWLVYTNLRTSAYAVFSRLEGSITIYVPCVSIVGNDELVSKLEDNFKNKSFNQASLSELEKEFKESLKDIDSTYLKHMLKGATFKTTMNNIEHEFIHAGDPASYQSKDDDEQTLQDRDAQYDQDYYGTPEANAGKIPAEFNPFFWNIVRSFETPLNTRTRQFLMDFIKDPQPLISKLKLFDIETLDVGKISNYILSFFNRKDKDYTTFLNILNNKHHRKLLIRIFQDSYLKKKFLQKLYSFVENS